MKDQEKSFESTQRKMIYYLCGNTDSADCRFFFFLSETGSPEPTGTKLSTQNSMSNRNTRRKWRFIQDILLPLPSFPSFIFKQTHTSLFLWGEIAPRWTTSHVFGAQCVRHFHWHRFIPPQANCFKHVRDGCDHSTGAVSLEALNNSMAEDRTIITLTHCFIPTCTENRGLMSQIQRTTSEGALVTTESNHWTAFYAAYTISGWSQIYRSNLWFGEGTCFFWKWLIHS